MTGAALLDHATQAGRQPRDDGGKSARGDRGRDCACEALSHARAGHDAAFRGDDRRAHNPCGPRRFPVVPFGLIVGPALEALPDTHKPASPDR